ncbi:MAG: mitochondrial fission ELM1 family protein [Candidatus Omnitrophica bacterium]|nr:mitochondrial fission ELM1 family protein [Candidatus Omnitrophota bacterium]
MNKDSIIDFLGFITVKVFSAFLRCMPLAVALWIGRRGGDLACLVNVKRRSIAYANLKAAFPEKDAGEISGISRQHFRNLGMSIIELLKVPVMGKGYLGKYVSIENIDRIRAARDKGKGVIILAAHFGNWEISSLATSARGYGMYVFAREQKYARLNNLLNRYREMTGCKVVAKGFSVRDIIKTLHDNGIVAMLADQDAGANGVFVEFLGRPASTAQGAVSFALRTGAIILPSFTLRVGPKGHVLEIGEPLGLINTQDKKKDLKANLEKITSILEAFIKRFPDQWLWSHKRWKSTPVRAVLVLSDGKAGHLNQARAVAEMVEEALGSRLKARGIVERPVVKIDVVEVKFKNRFARMLLDASSIFASRRCQGCMRCLRFLLKKESFDSIKNHYADIVVSCGAATVAANIFLKYENNAKGICVMNPGLGRGKSFDVVILPRHDAPGRVNSNILITEAAPNRITPVRRSPALPAGRRGEGGNDERRTTNHGIGLLIGGDAKNFRLTKETVVKVVDGILKIAEETGLDIFASTSRRTSLEIDEFLKERLGNNKRCKLLVIANEKNREAVVPEIFSSSEVVVVSPESISMISEAASGGKYVIVFSDKRQATRDKEKYGRVVENLEKQGYINTAEPDKVYDLIKDILQQRPAVKRLDDRKKITERLQAVI